LVAAANFEDAAASVLSAMIDIATQAIAAGRFSGRGKVMRGMVHLRPGDGYRRLLVVEEGTRRAVPVGSPAGAGSGDSGSGAYLPSATAWRWVAENRAPVSIDVNLGRVRVHRGEEPVVIREKGLLSGQFESRESVTRLLQRAATHVLVVPLRAPGGAVEGMISIEAACQSALGQDLLWADCGKRLQTLADVAAPYLLALPLGAATPAPPDEFLPVVGASMAGIIQMARVFALQDETILIGGPTGAGKSRLARWCHEQSPRRGKRFEGLDLNTVPEDLQMAELFGWRKGAFSGAVSDNPGFIARGEGGTLFIDEIDKLSLRAQAGLLHMLEERRYRPLGEGAGERRADVRFIVGTNADLQAAVRAGRFREDLYYRINVLPVKVPPLDERTDEIPAWAHWMLNRRHRARVADGEARLSDDATRALLRSRWPGNLRQLDNIVRRAYAIALVNDESPPREVVLQAAHVERALGYDKDVDMSSAVDLLERAAEAFVAEAARRGKDGPLLDLDLADGFRGFVLGAAARKSGSVEGAFRLLNKESMVSNRNHRKALKRELERATALCRELGRDESPLLADLADGDER
jgi:MoxR-like ATPase